MKKKFVWPFVVVMFFPLTCLAYPVADYFDFPVGGYNPSDSCLGWGGYNSKFAGRHVADDYCCAAGTQVKAIAKGRVKYLLYDPQNQGGTDWYSLIVIEHTLYNGSKICSIYGHTRGMQTSLGDSFTLTVGQEITYAGQPIGRVIEYPPSSNHVHFGIYNGAWQGAEGADPFAWLKGYVSSVSWPGNYLEPISFIQFHQTNNPSYFPYPNHSVIKFSDSPECYLYSGLWLWHIDDELTYALLGYNNGNCQVADCSTLYTIPASQRASYAHMIRGETIPIQGLVVKIVDQVGPNTCSPRDSWRDPNSIYVFDGTNFRPIINESVYFALGYQNNWTDVVDITQNLFNRYGEGYIIDSPEDAWWIIGPGGGGYLDAVPAPLNLSVTNITTDSVQLDYEIPRIYTDFGIILYIDGIETFRGQGINSLIISNIPPSTNHCYNIAVYILNTSEESDMSNTVCATTLPSEISYNYSGSWICEGYTGATYEPVTPRNEFTAGDTVFSLTKISNVTVDHRWKTEFYCNGAFAWADESPWLYVGSGWDYSAATPSWSNINPGDYIAKVWLDTGNGYQLLAENNFTVTNNGPDYVFMGSWPCKGYSAGSPDYWDLQPLDSSNIFTEGDTVYSLSKIKDVYADHRWKTEFFCNGVFSWMDESPWLDVGSGWGYSSAMPFWTNIGVGNYEIKVWLDTGNGYNLMADNYFSVNPPQARTIPYQENFNSLGGFILENNNGYGSLSVDTNDHMIIGNTQAGECWHVQAKKIGFIINNGTEYTHIIYAKADQPGRIYVAFQREVDPWENFGLWHAIDLTTEWQAFSMPFIANASPDPALVRYTIMTGAMTGNVYVDLINITSP